MKLLAALSCLSFLAALQPASADAKKTAFGFDELPKLASVSGVQIAPDGKRIAYVVSRPDMKKNEYADELDLADVTGGSVRALTHDRPHVGDPRWSPDGTQLAFIAPADDKKPQVFVLPMDGGEAAQVTQASEGVESYAWRPDGNAIAYVSPDKAPNEKAIKAHHDIFRVGNNDFLATHAPVLAHIWLQNLRDGESSGKPRQLTSGPHGAGGDLSWSADGNTIAFTQTPDAYSGDIAGGRAAVLDVAARRVRELSTETSSAPVFAPQGSAIAYTTGKDGLWAFYNQTMLYDGASSKVLAPHFEPDTVSLSWSGPHEVLIGTFEGASTGLWRVSTSGAAQTVPLGDVQTLDASASRDGALAFAGSTATDPSELYYLAPGVKAPRRLTDLNAFLARKDLGKTREITWQHDGFKEDGIVTYPPDFAAGKKYPLLLVIHGGPTGNGSTTAFSSLVQMMAAHGYIVFQPNYRGSDNLGFAYAKATMGDLDKGAGEDVVAGIRALEAQGSVDSARIGVSGWSAGGLMTSWLIGNYNLWKAAVTGAGVDDFVEEYDDEDTFDYMPALMGGATPWHGEGMALYRAHSPITYARNVKAATLILSDTSDYRVPTVQAYEFYHALRESGAPVEFDAIPAYGHFPSDPVQRFDVYRRWTQWLVTHV